MAKFEELNKYINDILTMLTDNQNLCKLLKYGDANALKQPDISEEERMSLVFDKIYPLPKLPDEKLVGVNSYLTVYFDNVEKGGSVYFKDSILTFNILSDLSIWRMSGKLRPYLIMHEIDQMLNNQKVLGIGKVEFLRSKIMWANKDFSGYYLQYRICDFS